MKVIGHQLREDTIWRKKASRVFQELRGRRWLGAVLLHCEQGFKRVKGYAGIKQVMAAIEAEQAAGRKVKWAA